jgi:manganese/zinc/iron transport system substrate-binding protein
MQTSRVISGWNWGGILGLTLAAWLIGCDGGGQDKSQGAAGGGQAASGNRGGKLTLVCTTAMVADVVRNVAGERAEVITLMNEGVDPHLYKPTRNDVVLIESADAVFYNGLMLEGKMGDVFVRAAREGRQVFALTESLEPAYLLEPEELQGHFDPHVWMDVSAWSKTADVVRDAVARLDPANAEHFAKQATAYQARLAELHEYVKKIIATIPANRRTLITAHDAFNYFGRAYAIEVRGIQGISTESEAGLDDVNRLVAFIVEREIPAVFVESSVAEKQVRALVEGVQAKGRKLEVGGTLYSDAMGAAGTYEGSYVGMIDHNATLIARALGGQAPEKGMSGKLAR